MAKAEISSDPKSPVFFWNLLSDERKYELVNGSTTNEMWNLLPHATRNKLVNNFRKSKKSKVKTNLKLVTQQAPKPEPLVAPSVMSEKQKPKSSKPLTAPVMNF